MNIIWLGHSCFVVESAGWRVVLDPYYVETYPALHIEADEALCSHGHRDHAFLEAVTLSGRDKSESPFTVDNPESKLRTSITGQTNCFVHSSTVRGRMCR